MCGFHCLLPKSVRADLVTLSQSYKKHLAAFHTEHEGKLKCRKCTNAWFSTAYVLSHEPELLITFLTMCETWTVRTRPVTRRHVRGLGVREANLSKVGRTTPTQANL